MRRINLLYLFVMVIPSLVTAQTDTIRVFFSVGSTEPTTWKRVDSAASLQQTHRLRIVGHADFLGERAANIALSQRRAKAVAQRMRLKGASTSMPVSAVGESESRENGSHDGEPFERRVDILLERSGNVQKRKNIASSTPGIQKDIHSLAEGESLALQGLSFIPGRHQVLARSEGVLRNLAKAMQTNPNLKIAIEGHVCCTENDDDGFDFDANDHHLSLNRARYVFEYLVKEGIDSTRMTYHGFGHSRPKSVTERTPEEEQLNRRVEVRVLAR